MDDNWGNGGRRLSGSTRLVIWVVVSFIGILVSLQVMFAIFDAARPVIGPIPDDSVQERLLVAAGYAVWFGLSALVSLVAWRLLLHKRQR